MGSSRDKEKNRWTQNQLYAAYKGRGPHRMTCDFLHEDGLQEELASYGLADLLEANTVATWRRKRMEWIDYNNYVANRAQVGSFLDTAIELLEVVHARLSPRPQTHTHTHTRALVHIVKCGLPWLLKIQIGLKRRVCMVQCFNLHTYCYTHQKPACYRYSMDSAII